MQLSEHTFKSWDGVELAYRAWTPPEPNGRFAMLFHRGHEHSARWDAFARSAEMAGYTIFAWDQRGHGRSPGERGSAPDLAAVIRDADRFARHLVAQHGVQLEKTAVIASSLGAVIATAWVHDFAPPIAALILAAAALEVKLYVPLAIPFLTMKERLLPGGKVKSVVRASMITADPAEQAAYNTDPLIFRQISVNLLLDLHFTGARLVDDAAAITTPMLMLVAGNDWVVRRRPQLEFFKRLSSPLKQLELLPTGRHALFNDVVAPQVRSSIRSFFDRAYTDAPHADPTTATRAEYDLLRTPSSPFWQLQRLIVKLGGVFSEGIRLGLQTGFDSGHSLDYVYRNQAAGRAVIGKIVDRGYLNAIGWRGIRVRRENLRTLLKQAIDQTLACGRDVHILDLAAGAGRYVLETIASLNGEAKKVSAELRDYRQSNLDAAAELAKSMGVQRVNFTAADAFDRSHVAAATPKPTIAIVSGLYELFPENEQVQQSLAGLADAVAEGGLLIYTGQPWHPQVEFIARALTNHRGERWIMRRRTQAELDSLVRGAGFEKIDQLIDRWGIFTVSLARRIPPSPGTPGEGGVRVLSQQASDVPFEKEPSPYPLPEYWERDKEGRP